MLTSNTVSKTPAASQSNFVIEIAKIGGFTEAIVLRNEGQNRLFGSRRQSSRFLVLFRWTCYRGLNTFDCEVNKYDKYEIVPLINLDDAALGRCFP
jgi:hypothetical protein